MGRIEPYRGKHVSAESAEKYIDLDAIISACNKIDAKAGRIGEYTNNIRESASILNPQNFSINNQSYQSIVSDYCSSINSVEQTLSNSTASIRLKAESEYNRIQEQLNYEAQQRDKYASDFSK